MNRDEIRTDKAAPPGGGYSQGVRMGNLIFVSGQGPLLPGSGEIVGSTIEEQTRLTLSNIREILAAAGASMDSVAKVTVYLADMDLFDRFDAVYGEFFTSPRPARATVAAGLLDILVEIDAIAVLSE